MEANIERIEKIREKISQADKNIEKFHALIKAEDENKLKLQKELVNLLKSR